MPRSLASDGDDRFASAPARAVLAGDNVTIRLTIYRESEALGATILDPVAVGLVGELIVAAHRRFTRRNFVT